MESEEWVEISAPTVEEAIILAITRLGITREEAILEILDEGSKGFLGIGAREARVRAKQRLFQPVPEPVAPVTTPEPRAEVAAPQLAAPEPAEPPADLQPEVPVVTPRTTSERAPRRAVSSVPVEMPDTPPVATVTKPQRQATVSSDLDRDAVERVVGEVADHFFAGLDLDRELSWRDKDRPALWVSLRGKDSDSLVGPRAQTLESVQYLFRTVVRRQVDGEFDLIIDADGYRGRRQRSLQKLARKMANKAAESGRPVQLRPMPASDRRVVHITLRNDKRVRTESSGSGSRRAVTIVPVRDAS